jgi:murein DD-endopeptidase MepM/ murein hydrolase activator NlpD
MVLRKSNNPRKAKSNFKTLIHRRISELKKTGASLWKNARPFLALKFWPIYFIAFSIGLYLWGPTRGWQKFQNWQSRQTQKRAKLPAAETLQRQLIRLRRELQTAQNEKKVSEFDPANFSRPALGEVIRGFEWVESGNSWRLHTGVDIGVSPGSNILASAAGTVTGIQEINPGNYMVTISHGDGWKSTYSNLVKVMVIEGQAIIKGVIVGTSANSGCDPLVPSFHFELYHGQQPVDPEKVISSLSNQNRDKRGNSQ